MYLPIILLAVSSIFSVGMTIFRVVYGHTWVFSFMIVNITLAWIPLLFSLLIDRFFKQRKHVAAIFILFLWVLFYPNTLYIATDLMYLTPRFIVPFWFDILMLFSYTWNGILFGFLSLYIVEMTLKKYLKWRHAHFFSLAILVISSFGIYIGRFLRWYSWDIVLHPLAILRDMGEMFFYPGPNLLMIVFTTVASILSILLYELFLVVVRYIKTK